MPRSTAHRSCTKTRCEIICIHHTTLWFQLENYRTVITFLCNTSCLTYQP